MTPPRLVDDLKKALKALSENESVLQAAAHEFLIKIQSRNLRRRLQSLSRKDSNERVVATADLLHAPSSASQHFLGSSWLACLNVLVDPDAVLHSEQERLFCSQTLLHRLRRVRISEAVDAEFEASGAEEIVDVIDSKRWSDLFQSYLPNAILADASTNWSALLQQYAHEETLIKGLWAIISLGHATTVAVASSSSRPVVETLLLALATATFRLRYTAISSPPSPGQALYPVPPMLELLRQALHGSNSAELFVMAIATMFDAILGSPGGARGRMSCEPSATLAAALELRTSILPKLHSILALASSSLAAQACARIAPFATLPWDCVTYCSPDECLWMALYDSASQSLEIMATNMTGVEMLNQRKKGRKKDTLSLPDTDSERKARGEIACRATVHAASEQLWASNPSILAAAANACLPHCVRHGSSSDLELMTKLSQAFQIFVCSNPVRNVRALALEPLYTLHAVILDEPSRLQEIAGSSKLLVTHFTQCCFRLAEGSIYPADYFKDLSIPSDHDLEVERNDMRDLIRTIAGSGEGGSTSKTTADDSHYPIPFSIDVITELLAACTSSPLSEPVAHVFSSLAKPLNHLAKCTAKRPETWSDGLVQQVFRMTVQFLNDSNEQVILMFDRDLSIAELLPLNRVVSISNASYSPFLAASIRIPDYQQFVPHTLDVIVRSSIKSMEVLPELIAPSILEHSAYDIRGAMRAPGGDDHVGCVCLMRLTSDSLDLTNATTHALCSYGNVLGQLYRMWKEAETERGRSVFHGSGVTPRTRRILLTTLCKAEGLSSMLHDLFLSAITSISSLNLAAYQNSEDGFYILTESVFDLGAFSSGALSALFCSNEEAHVRCFHIITQACLEGYRHFSTMTPDAIVEWNRLRAAIFTFICNAHPSDLSRRATEVLLTCITAECEACLNQLRKQVDEPSQLFQDQVIASDGVPAGLFIQVIGLAIQQCSGVGHLPLNCIKTLCMCKSIIHSMLTFNLAEPKHFEDPRCTTAEAWFTSMGSLAGAFVESPERMELLLDSTLIATSLLFTPPIRKNSSVSTRCMTLDGPQGLTILTFLASLIRKGGAVLHEATSKLRDSVPVDMASVVEPDLLGTAILVACIFRAFQGALPPWAIEQAPDLFSALYESMECNPELFGRVILSAMELRASNSFGSVQCGTLLSGPFFAPLQKDTKHKFIQEVKQLGATNSVPSWRRVKVLIKRVCGGKKKNTDFNQKPALTRWNFSKI